MSLTHGPSQGGRRLRQNSCHIFSILVISFLLFAEQMLRDKGKPLFGSLAARQNDCLRALIKFAIMSSQSHLAKPELIKEHCIKQLACKLYYFLENSLQRRFLCLQGTKWGQRSLRPDFRKFCRKLLRFN